MMRIPAALAALVALCAGAAPPPKPKLLLVISVDQFRADYLARFGARYTAGLARLVKDGAVFTNAHYDHFPTVTAVGHATILSGASPSTSGIMGNEWYDRVAGRQVTSVSDTAEKTLGAPAREAASPRRLMVSTIGDELKMAGRASKVVGMSSKDRSAILPVGHRADGAYWFDTITGNFVSSTYYFKQLPAWVQKFNQSRVADQWVGKEWTPLGGGTAFSKLPAEAGRLYAAALDGTPFHNDLLVLFAQAAVEHEQLGAGEATDVLSISFSANDRIGHRVGPHDPSVEDVSVRTDLALGRLFDYLDKRIGMASIAVVFTADHGVAPLPEYMQKNRMPGGRMTEESVLDAVELALSRKYGEGKWVVGKSGPAAYLDHRMAAARELDLEAVQETAAAAVRQLPHIARVYTREDLRRGALPNDMIARRVRNGFLYQRAADLFIVPEPYYLFERTGTSHGTPYNYDTHVPVIFLGAAFKPGRYHAAVTVNDIAPTLATVLEIETPSGSTGRPLAEILDER